MAFWRELRRNSRRYIENRRRDPTAIFDEQGGRASRFFRVLESTIDSAGRSLPNDENFIGEILLNRLHRSLDFCMRSAFVFQTVSCMQHGSTVPTMFQIIFVPRSFGLQPIFDCHHRKNTKIYKRLVGTGVLDCPCCNKEQESIPRTNHLNFSP